MAEGGKCKKAQRKSQQSSGLRNARKVLKHLRTHPQDKIARKAADALSPLVVRKTGIKVPAA